MKSERRSRTIEHDVLHGSPAYTIYPANARTLQLVALVTADSDALALETALADGRLVALDDDDQPALVPAVRLTGTLARELDPVTAAAWIVTAAVTEVVL